MEYKGRLYGKMHQTYFETGKTSDDYDNLEKEVVELKNKLKESEIHHDYRLKANNDIYKQYTDLESRFELLKISKENLEKENENLSKGYDDWHNLYSELKRTSEPLERDNAYWKERAENAEHKVTLLMLETGRTE